VYDETYECDNVTDIPSLAVVAAVYRFTSGKIRRGRRDSPPPKILATLVLIIGTRSLSKNTHYFSDILEVRSPNAGAPPPQTEISTSARGRGNP
jgi:hypothetical protein